MELQEYKTARDKRIVSLFVGKHQIIDGKKKFTKCSIEQISSKLGIDTNLVRKVLIDNNKIN